MSALSEIIVEFCQVSKDHPNALGEILRRWAFTGDGYGCYSTFEIRPEFEPVEATPREFKLLWGRDYDPDPSPDIWSDYCDANAIKEIHWFRHPSGIEMGWHWDGDGLLAFYTPELEDEYYNGALYNHDCKKDYDWKFGERLA